jgi:glucose/mannose transport system substrate-binding protein
MHLEARLGYGARSLARGLLQDAAVLLGLAVLGCGDSPETVRLDVYNWWDQPEEKVAFDAVARMHEEQHDNVEVRNLDSDDATDARQEMSMRMLANAPPATFLANIGADVLQWAVVDTQSVPNAPVNTPPDSSESYINPLSDLFRDTGFTVPPELEEQLRIGEETGPFAVPLNIHRVNVLYYNRARRELFEERTQKTLLSIDTLCPAEPDAEPLGREFAVPLASSWTLILLIFENILPALIANDSSVDDEYYKTLFLGDRDAEAEGGPSPMVDKALECAQYLSRSMIDGSIGMEWAGAIQAVADGTATFTVMGDWANPLLKDELEAETVVAVPFPGTEELYVYTSDTFPLPIGVDHAAETVELLKTFASKDAQIVFSQNKGSIPARLGVDFDAPFGWSSFQKWTDARQKLLATSGYFPPYYPDYDLGLVLVPMMTPNRDGSVNPSSRASALRYFTDLEPLLKRWQDRLGAGPAEPRSQ